MRPSRLVIISVSIVVIGLAVSCVIVGDQLYFRPRDNALVRWLADQLPLPAGTVSGHVVLYRDYLARIDALNQFQKTAEAQAQGYEIVAITTLRERAYEQTMRVAVLEDLSKQHDVVVRERDIDRAFTQLLSQASVSSTADIDAFLGEQFGWSADDYKRFVVRPILLQQGLKIEVYNDDQQSVEEAIQRHLNSTMVKRYLNLSVTTAQQL